MICSECGNYQPDRAKFCGICGSALSQEGLIESFLKDEGDDQIVIPRHRSPLFYLAIVLVVLLALAIAAGAGYLVYRAAWGGRGNGPASGSGIQDNTLPYVNDDIGFTFSYLNNWKLEQGYPVRDQLVSVKLSLSAKKNLELTGYQLDPLVTIGGLEGIKGYLAEDASKRMLALGAEDPRKGLTGSGSGQQAYPPAGTGQSNPMEEGEDNVSSDIFIASQVNGLPVFYLDFNANAMGEETTFILYYIVADDYYFLFQGQSPQSEFKDVRPQIMATAGSFKWVRPEAPLDEGAQPTEG